MTFVPAIALQGFVVVMILMVAIGTLVDMAHKKNAKYFFINFKRAKESATNELSGSQKAKIISKTIASDILTTSELGRGQRRIAHLLGMYGSILFWAASVVLIFGYANSSAPYQLSLLWHVGAIMTCLGGYWFWFFLRVDVSAEANPWNRIILSLIHI